MQKYNITYHVVYVILNCGNFCLNIFFMPDCGESNLQC